MLYLVDTGRNTNLVSKRVFNRLTLHIQNQRISYDSRGQLANSTKRSFNRVVQTPIKVRYVKLEDIFVVSQISKDAILGMLILANPYNVCMQKDPGKLTEPSTLDQTMREPMKLGSVRPLYSLAE